MVLHLQSKKPLEPPDEANIKTRLHSPNDANASTSQGPLDHEITDESFGLLHRTQSTAVFCIAAAWILIGIPLLTAELPLIFVLLPTLGSAVLGSAYVSLLLQHWIVSQMCCPDVLQRGMDRCSPADPCLPLPL